MNSAWEKAGLAKGTQKCAKAERVHEVLGEVPTHEVVDSGQAAVVPRLQFQIKHRTCENSCTVYWSRRAIPGHFETGMFHRVSRRWSILYLYKTGSPGGVIAHVEDITATGPRFESS